jgi:uncharacterized protein
MGLICIVSDTHGDISRTEEALGRIRPLAPDLVLHCGDIGDASFLSMFAELNVRFVLGNCDHGAELNREAERLGWEKIGSELELSVLGRRFYMYHGTKHAIIDEMAGAQLYDYVLHGHTHERRDEVLGRTRIINPGAIHRTRTPSFAALDPERDVVEFVLL